MPREDLFPPDTSDRRTTERQKARMRKRLPRSNKDALSKRQQPTSGLSLLGSTDVAYLSSRPAGHADVPILSGSAGAIGRRVI
jgi:hypothetical protein